MLSGRTPRSARWAAVLYAFELRLLRRSFRRRYAGEALRLFDDLTREAHDRSGVAGVAGVWMRSSLDLWRRVWRRPPLPRRRPPMLDSVRQDLLDAVRQLRRSPGYAVTTVLTLTLAFAAGTAIFGLVDGTLLDPLPYRDADDLALLRYRYADTGGIGTWISVPDFADYRARATRLDGLAAVDAPLTFTMTGAGDPERLPAARVSADFLTVLGVTPILGRDFTPAEDDPSAEPVALISHGLWQRRFGADASVIGEVVSFDGRPTTIIGVLPADFEFPVEGDVWGNFIVDPGNFGRRLNLVMAVARVDPEAGMEAARAELVGIAVALEQEYPDTNTDYRAELTPLLDAWVDDERTALWMLGGAAVLTLLITCANVANLQLARAPARRREIAVRKALGAGTSRLVRQFCAEGLGLGLIGGGLGVVLGAWATGALVALLPASTPRLENVGVDAGVMVAVLALAAAAGLALGALNAHMTRDVGTGATLRDGRAVAGHGDGLRAALVIAEVAVAVVLLVGAGLLVRSLGAALDEDPGFRTDRLLTMKVSLPRPLYPEPADRVAFFDELLAEAAAVPGVTAVSLASGVPLQGGNRGVGFYYPGGPEEGVEAGFRAVWPGYFETMGIPALAGRDFNRADLVEAPPVVIVSRSLAEQVWPSSDGVGRRISFDSLEGPWAEVVGIVDDVRDQALDDVPLPILYVAYPQRGWTSMTLVARGVADAERLAGPLRERVWNLDARQPVYDVATMDELLARSVAPRRLRSVVLALFAVAAFLLAAVGVYGVLAASVRERTRELGIRMALGAEPRDVVAGVLRRGVGLVILGAFAGALAALGLARFVNSLLYGVTPLDPVTLAAVAASMLALAAAACYRPARRATRIDPVEALRED